MGVDRSLLERAAVLKGELVAFGEQSPRMAKHLRRELDRRLVEHDVAVQDELINTVDRFLLQRRLPDGRTPLAHFCEARRDLSAADRGLLNGWHDVVEGIFEVERRADGDGAVETHNVIDEMTYRIVSNVGPAMLTGARRREFLLARVVPLGDGHWMLSGTCSILPRAARPRLLRAAAQQAMSQPELALRNPDKLAHAWQLQHYDRELFIAHFGADTVVIDGSDLRRRWSEYWQWRRRQPATPGGQATGRGNVTSDDVDFDLAEALHDAASVGIIYDETEGPTFLAEFARVQAAFATPRLACEATHRRAVRHYLHDDSVTTLPFRRLAEPDPERASQVLAYVLNKPKFRWDRDGEALLRKHKPHCFQTPPLPSIVPLGEPLARALRVA